MDAIKIDDLVTKIDRLLDPIFAELQAEYGIKTGDVSFGEIADLTEIEEKLAIHILKMVENQKKYNR